MSFMLTASGLEYHFDNQHQKRPVLVEDIAHHLAILNRFHGATSRPYSVAEHSLFVSEIAQRHGLSLAVQLAALMHDGHEAYTNDMASPAKYAIDALSLQGGCCTPAWAFFEGAHAQQLRATLGLRATFSRHGEVLRRMDKQALATERRDLMRYDRQHNSPWAVLGDGEVDPAAVIEPIEWAQLNTPEREAMTWRDWRQVFLDRYEELTYGLQLQQEAAPL